MKAAMADGQKDGYGSSEGGTDSTSQLSFIPLINIHKVSSHGPGTTLGTGDLAMKPRNETYKVLHKASALACTG